MSSRKRPLGEISQSTATPARYAPSTPHAIRALQERSGAKQRSVRSVRHVNHQQSIGNTVRPDGSARNILRQFAKITAPLTKKRISTPVHTSNDKENTNPDDSEDDSILTKKPPFTIEEGTEEDDSELIAAPTPSILPDEDDDEQPTITFRNLAHAEDNRPVSERIDGRKSRLSMVAGSEGDVGDQNGEDVDADFTLMTERGRRALSEEATGRLSRYSFGSIRMSDFGPELEIRRESGQLPKSLQLDSKVHTDYNDDNAVNLDGDMEELGESQASPTEVFNDESLQLPAFNDDTFALQLPDEQTTSLEQAAHAAAAGNANAIPVRLESVQPAPGHEVDHSITNDDEASTPAPSTTSRQQTLLENATTAAQTTRRKCVKLTRHGNTVPALPTSLVKRIAVETQTQLGRRKPKLGRDHVKALEQATEWFFEQVGEDLAAYSSHGRRKKRVDEDDVFLLMRRQKLLYGKGELQKLAKEWLPSDILKQLDLPDRP